MPEYSGITGLAFMASLGLPGLAGFIGEFLVFVGAFVQFRIMTILSATAVIITAAYYLWTMQRMFLGQLNEKWKSLLDMNWRERLTLYPLARDGHLLRLLSRPDLRPDEQIAPQPDGHRASDAPDRILR